MDWTRPARACCSGNASSTNVFDPGVYDDMQSPKGAAAFFVSRVYRLRRAF
jgi:hypothetical protein